MVPRDFYVIDENFAINLIHPKFQSLLLTDKIPIGVTERGSLTKIPKRVHITLFKGCA